MEMSSSEPDKQKLHQEGYMRRQRAEAPLVSGQGKRLKQSCKHYSGEKKQGKVKGAWEAELRQNGSAKV